MFMTNQLIGFGAFDIEASVFFTANAKNDNALTTYTFSTQSIGAAQAGRRIIVAAGCPANGVDRTISSVTIGGDAATAIGTIASGAGGGAFAQAQLFVLQVDTGTTADIVVTWSGAADRCSVGVWAAYDLQSSTPTATLTSTANPQTGTINVSAGGILIAAAFDFNGVPTAATFTWAGPTERYDAQFVATNLFYSGASDAYAAAQTGLTVTATPSVFTAGAMAAASFR